MRANKEYCLWYMALKFSMEEIERTEKKINPVPDTAGQGIYTRTLSYIRRCLSILWILTDTTINEPRHVISNNVVFSDEPMQPPVKIINSKSCSLSSLTLIEYSSNKQRLWSDRAYAQADLRLWWQHIPHCWKSRVTTQMYPLSEIPTFSLRYRPKSIHSFEISARDTNFEISAQKYPLSFRYLNESNLSLRDICIKYPLSKICI